MSEQNAMDREASSAGRYLTLEEAAAYLHMPSSQLEQATEVGELPGYRIGGVYLRFRQGDLDAYIVRKQTEQRESEQLRQQQATRDVAIGVSQLVEAPGIMSRTRDFLYLNDFYLLAGLMAGILVWLILQSHF